MGTRAELEKLTATKLREIAHEQDGIQGTSGMKKEELVIAILEARGEPIDDTVKDVETISALKKNIKAIKAEREKAREAQDSNKDARLRKQIKKLKRQTRCLAGRKKSPSKE